MTQNHEKPYKYFHVRRARSSAYPPFTTTIFLAAHGALRLSYLRLVLYYTLGSSGVGGVGRRVLPPISAAPWAMRGGKEAQKSIRYYFRPFFLRRHPRNRRRRRLHISSFSSFFHGIFTFFPSLLSFPPPAARKKTSLGTGGTCAGIFSREILSANLFWSPKKSQRLKTIDLKRKPFFSAMITFASFRFCFFRLGRLPLGPPEEKRRKATRNERPKQNKTFFLGREGGQKSERQTAVSTLPDNTSLKRERWGKRNIFTFFA